MSTAVDPYLVPIVTVALSVGAGYVGAHVRIAVLQSLVKQLRADLDKLDREAGNVAADLRAEFMEAARHAHERIDKIFEQTQRILKIKAVE